MEPVTEYPARIVCLTEETTETLYLLGEDARIVGISGYTVRPPEARKKPKVSAFISAQFDKILQLAPDVVFAFSDLQADIARELIRRGITVFTFNQRTVREILQTILTVARIVGAQEKGQALVARLQAHLEAIAAAASTFPHRPRVLFEEWNDPLISGIHWVEELVEIAGGQPIFPELRQHQGAKDRIVRPEDVIPADPEVIIGSCCGRKLKRGFLRSREGWSAISAVRQGHIYEIKSTYILQPGPAALTEGVRQLHAVLAHVVGCAAKPELAPEEHVDKDLAR